MHIDGSGPFSNLIKGTKEGETPQKKANSSLQQTSAGTNDTVTLTRTAENLRRLEQEIASSSIVNSHKIEQMQQAVNDGHININPTQLADKLFNFESALNSARTGV